jgi:hypothetical protein
MVQLEQQQQLIPEDEVYMHYGGRPAVGETNSAEHAPMAVSIAATIWL